ncbi:RNA polymerase sigma-I factor [Paludifilum halophilum]|uniref:RNA polymerase sigma-I factor n=1 Tax=Paludifilum halophilum TaxID=1642702 RepID=UPI00146B56D4|nr:RNA polymerase sigma-I factor [Paludifilum halophilum]
MHVPGDGDRYRKKRELEERVLKAQTDSSSEYREELLGEHQTYIKKIASRICKRPVTNQDDEFSIALSGFNEAISRYEPDQPSSFLTFAYMVVQRRLADYYRREQKHQNQLPLVPPGSKENESHYPEVIAQSFARYRERELAEMRRSELAQFAEALNRYKIRIRDLVHVSPKHRDTREDMLKIACRIAAEKDLREQFFRGKRIKKEFAERVGCHRRTLKRHRTYLIALVLVIVEDLPLMREYLDLPIDMKGGGNCAEGDCHGSRSAALGSHDTGR